MFHIAQRFDRSERERRLDSPKGVPYGYRDSYGSTDRFTVAGRVTIDRVSITIRSVSHPAFTDRKCPRYDGLNAGQSGHQDYPYLPRLIVSRSVRAAA